MDTYYTAEDLDAILPSRFKPQPDTSLHGWARAGAQAINAPKRAVASTAGMLQSVGDLLSGGAPREFRDLQANQRELADRDWWYRNREVGRPSGFADSLTDVAVGGILPELPGMLLPAGAIGKGAKLLGAGRAAPVVGDIATGAISGYRDSAGEAGLQAGEFGAMGTVGAMLPQRFRPLLRATAEGAAGYGIGMAGQGLRGNDPFSAEAQTQAGVMGVMPFAMQGRRLFSRGLARELPIEGQPSSVDSGGPMGGGIPAEWKLRQRTERAEGGYDYVFDTPDGPRAFPSSEYFGGQPQRRLFEPKIPDDLGTFPQAEGDVFGNVQKRPTQPAGKGGEINRTPSVEPEGGVLRSAATEVPASPRQGIEAEAQARGVRYDGPMEVPGGAHQFTDPRTGGTFVVRGEFTPQKFADKLDAQTMRFGKLRPISRSGSEAGSIHPDVLAGLAGATVGYVVDEERGALLGAAAGPLGRRFGKRLLAKLPDSETSARQQVTGIGGKTLFGKAQRVGEKYFKAGRDPKLDVISEQARGTVHTLASDVGQALQAAAPKLKELTPPQRAALKIFMSTDRSAGPKAILAAAALPKEVMDFVDIATSRKSELQQILADAQGDPVRKKLIQDTIGTWVTEPYRAYVNPKEWQRKGVAPAMVNRLVQLNQRDPNFAGLTPDKIRKDVEEWLSEVANFGGDFSRMATEGKTRMSESLFTKRKQLRPIVQKILGKIHDPIEREVLSVAKLVKSGTTAKVVSELMGAKDSAGNRFTLTEKEWQAELNTARAAGDAAREQFLMGYANMPDTLKGLGELSKKDGERLMAQRQVKDMLQAGIPHGGVDWEKGWLGAMGKLNRLPKAAFTLYNPGTWAHNFLQAPLQALSAGLAPWSLVSNLRRLHADPQKLRWAKEDGIMDAHMGAGEFRRAADQYEKVLNPGKTEVFRKVHEAVKAGYGKPDQWVRGAAYLKFLDEGQARGMAPKEARAYAVENTNRYTQNYSNVAPAVALLRNVPFVNPFISYTAEMARIIRNLAEDVVHNTNGRRIPSAFALATFFGLGAGARALFGLGQSEEEQAGHAGIKSVLPPYARGRTTIDFGYDAAKGTNRSLNLNPWLPAEDFVTTARNLLNGDMSALWQTNPLIGANRTPALNLLQELTTKEDPVTGAPSEGTFSALRKNLLPPLFPGNYTAERVRQGFAPNAEGGLGVTDATGRTETPMSAVGRIFGVNVTTNDRRKLLSRQQSKAKEEDRQAKMRLNRVLRSNVEEGTKEEARAEYREERRRIFGR